MPGPELLKKKSTKPLNPLKAWKEGREEKKRALENQVAQEITEDIASNEIKIVQVLKTVNFLDSKLPPEVLNKKKKEEHPCGELEFACNASINALTNSPKAIQVDMRPVDEKILKLAYIFKDAVEFGQITTAEQSKNGLIRGIYDIRSKVPSERADLAKSYVEANARYLESYITLCGHAQEADAITDTLRRDQNALDAAETEYKEANDAQFELLTKDRKMEEAFSKVLNTEAFEERENWDVMEREAHLMMVEQRMKGVTLDLLRRKVDSDEKLKLAAESRVNTLAVNVAGLPIVVDPDLMNKYQEEIDNIFSEFAKADTKIDETLKSLDDIDGRIKQLETAPGMVRAREVAAEEARKFLEKIKSTQDDELNEGFKKGSLLEGFGIKSEEEMAALKAKIEEQEAASLEAMSQMVATEETSDLLYE